MTIIAIDDTDSRTEGMCTTYVATRIAEAVQQDGWSVSRRLLVRLNPGVKRKTRGNAALALHTDCPADIGFETAKRVVSQLTAQDARNSPGVVVAHWEPGNIPPDITRFCEDAMRHIHALSDAVELIERYGLRHAAVTTGAGMSKSGYGRIGALAAIGAWNAFDQWTYEYITYRELDQCGTERLVDDQSVFTAADDGYPVVWDTVDKREHEPVCVPNAPGPILFGIRGDDPEACEDVASQIRCEPVDYETLFQTNQGTDAHINRGEIGHLRDQAGYRVDGIVVSNPETIEGGHTFVTIGHPDGVTVDEGTVVTDPSVNTVDCAAFEPTKRFRNVVLDLRKGDRVQAVGEYENGTIKLEKLKLCSLNRATKRNPICHQCSSRMNSAGRDQGYRCQDCGTHADEKRVVERDRELSEGWYEVPPCARRHVAKPIIRGGFEGTVHPSR